jgi:hypothetical protein
MMVVTKAHERSIKKWYLLLTQTATMHAHNCDQRCPPFSSSFIFPNFNAAATTTTTTPTTQQQINNNQSIDPSTQSLEELYSLAGAATQPNMDAPFLH